MHGFSDTAGSGHLTERCLRCLPSTDLKASAPRINAFSVLKVALPIRTATDASPAPSRGPTHGSRTKHWFGYSFVSGDLHPLPSASSPGSQNLRTPIAQILFELDLQADASRGTST